MDKPLLSADASAWWCCGADYPDHDEGCPQAPTVGPFPQEPAPGSAEAVAVAAETIRGFTPGPWHPCGKGRGGCSCGYVFGGGGDVYVAKALALADGIDPVAGDEERKANAALIAAAPDLLRERDEQRAEVERLRAEVEEAEGRTLLSESASILRQQQEAAARYVLAEKQRDALASEVRDLLSVEQERDSLRTEVERAQERALVCEERLWAFHRAMVAAGYPSAEPAGVEELHRQRDALADALESSHAAMVELTSSLEPQVRWKFRDLFPMIEAALRLAGRLP